ncbi:PDZ domain-containing protein [Leptotrichia sp. OH3620_COT-345]|uniref:S1C family serine protease n=1 Tax=Leptotrichia sp. OH3620_COT-345 TaxID=2491048 RepID=UPI000F64AFAC|nr:trypsin-like peptidase domain-containing protein [Leptotrichia sp. OH3620_COT-345]RRD41035.1 PDZ domain-containing protein [Leptotrichia sp. OH3620_COT-345]
MKLKKILATSFLLAALSLNGEIVNKSTSGEAAEKASFSSVNSSNDIYRVQDAFSNVYEKSKDSIVNIRTKKTIIVNTYNPLEELLFGTSGRRQIKKESGSLGSGFIISDNGYVMTNNHVIDGANEIFVKLSDGNEYSAKLVGSSPEIDIAILKINSNKKFIPLRFANSDSIKIGHWAIAFGNPLGLNSSMTVGVIGALGRSSLGIEQIENFIQTDAAINQGNSGGPLLDINGNVIGVNTAIFSTTGGSIGIGFAIPSNLAQNVKDSIIRTGRFERPYLGVSIADLSSLSAGQTRPPYSYGVYINKVFENSPAAKYGIREKDIILELNNKRILSASSFIGELAAKRIGDTISLKIYSNGKEKNINLVLEKFNSRN